MRNILQITAEMTPFVKVGGLADVCLALPKHLQKQGVVVKVVTPQYLNVSKQYAEQIEMIEELNLKIGNKEVKICLNKLLYEGIEVYLIKCPYYFERENVYGYSDEAERFIVLTKAVLNILPRIEFKPDIIHYHDWHMGYLPLFVERLKKNNEFYKRIKTILTIHNFEYQGIFDIKDTLELLEIDEATFYKKHLDFYGQVNFMHAGLLYSDQVTTVSPTYAQELNECKHEIGMSTQKPIKGILNGLDLDVYNPSIDKNIIKNFNIENVEVAKRENKIYLQEKLGLEVREDVPVIAMVARLIKDKGYDLVEYVYERLLKDDVQFIIMGDGSEYYDSLFRNLDDKYSNMRYLAYDDQLVRQIYAGADLFLMPSHYEPCGTTQLIAMRYGTVPIVRATGGLKDTVIDYLERPDEGYGFTFKPLNCWVMLYCIRQAVEVYRQKEKWQCIVHRAMQVPKSWELLIKEYIEMYNE